jgi:hypothetical protein
MGGRAILFLVIGFSTIFLIMEKNIETASTRAVDNMASYYTNMNVHNIAVGGANVGANQIFLDPTWTAGYNNVSYSGGSYTVSVDIINAFTNTRRLTSIGHYEGYSDTVQVTLQPSSFSKFAYYSVSEGNNPTYWITGDTVWGPLHTQDKLTISGDPVFNGKVTTKSHFVTKGYSNPQFNGGYQTGVDMPLPPGGTASLKGMADNGGVDFSGHDTVYVTFAGDSIKYKYSYSSPYTSALASALAPNGAIFASGAVLRLQGTVTGKYSIGASQETKTVTTTTTNKKGKTTTTTTTTTIGGDVYLDGNIVYNTNPRTDPSSTDLLGIVAQNNVLITDNSANRSNINIQAAVYAETGGFGAENYDSRPISGTINLYGGIQQKGRLPVGTFHTNGSKLYLDSGFLKDYRYDNRFMIASPPGYPNTGKFEIVSWYE